MSGSRDTAAKVGYTGQAAAATPRRSDAVLGWWAIAGIVTCLLVMIGASLLRTSWQPQVLIMPIAGPPWEITSRISAKVIVVALWLGALIGGGGLVAGLVAVRRGLPVPIRPLIAAGAIGVAVLLLLPPVGSTDSLDYAVYGHIVALGHSPYVMTPLQYKHVTHLRFSAPLDYPRNPSYYGPLATFEQLVATKLAGVNLARTILWLKFFNAIALGAVALAADRRFRADRASRLRAHLLWTANPLLIWSMMASAHLDVLAAAVGLAGLLLIDRTAAAPRPASSPGRRREWLWALAAGACVGAATDIKIDYGLFMLAAGWALRDRRRELAAAAVGAAVILVPSYVVAGVVAIEALSGRVSVGLGSQYYGPIFHVLGISQNAAVGTAVILMFPLTALALARMPDGFVVPSAVRAGLAFSMAWLLLWPHQYVWYSVMFLCVLVFYPASRLDWVAVAAFIANSIASLPGIQIAARRVMGTTLDDINYQMLAHFAPLVLLCSVVAFAILCVNQRWHALGRALPLVLRQSL